MYYNSGKGVWERLALCRGELRFACSHAVVTHPQKAGIQSAGQMQKTFLFTLLHGKAKLFLFRLLRAEKDEATGTTFFLYEVLP